MRRTTIAVGACTLFLLVGQATANTVVFDNLGSSDIYGTRGGWTGHKGQSYRLHASEFVPSGSGLLEELWAGMFLGVGQNEITLSLLSDSAGVPDATLWQGTFTDVLGGYGSVLHVSDLDGPMIDAGTRYWLVAGAPRDGVTRIAWASNAMNDRGDVARNINDTGWTVRTNSRHRAMRVAVLPEPTTLALLALGGLVGCRRRR